MIRSLLSVATAALLYLAAPAASAAADTVVCPTQVDGVLSSADYAHCLARVAVSSSSSASNLWAFAPEASSDTLCAVDACVSALKELQWIEFESCVATIGTTRVSVDRDVLQQHTEACARRKAEHAVSTPQLRRRLEGETKTNYDWLYISIAASVALSLLCCAISACRRRQRGDQEGGSSYCLVCCIPIPLCC